VGPAVLVDAGHLVLPLEDAEPSGGLGCADPVPLGHVPPGEVVALRGEVPRLPAGLLEVGLVDERDARVLRHPDPQGGLGDHRVGHLVDRVGAEQLCGLGVVVREGPYGRLEADDAESLDEEAGLVLLEVPLGDERVTGVAGPAVDVHRGGAAELLEVRVRLESPVELASHVGDILRGKRVTCVDPREGADNCGHGDLLNLSCGLSAVAKSYHLL
jgi:hypothetical protein